MRYVNLTPLIFHYTFECVSFVYKIIMFILYSIFLNYSYISTIFMLLLYSNFVFLLHLVVKYTNLHWYKIWVVMTARYGGEDESDEANLECTEHVSHAFATTSEESYEDDKLSFDQDRDPAYDHIQMGPNPCAAKMYVNYLQLTVVSIIINGIVLTLGF